MSAEEQRRLHQDPDTNVWHLSIVDRDGIERRTSLETTNLKLAERRVAHPGRQADGPPPMDTAAEADPKRARVETGSLEWALIEHMSRLAPDLAEATQGAYRGQAGHVVRLLGRVPVGQLKRNYIDDYMGRRRGEGVCAETIRKELMLLRAAIRRVAELGVAAGEPEGLLFPKLKSSSVPRDRWLTFEEYQKVMQQLPAPRQLQLLVACYTGARRAELMRMRWEDIDWARLELTVHQSKPKKSRRTVPLPAELKGMLLGLRKHRGTLLPTFNNLYREIARAADKVGVAHFTLNDCRRTFASWMLQGGVPLYDVSKLLGHRSIAMVQKVYGHLSGDSFRRAVAALPSSEKTAKHEHERLEGT